MGIIFYGVKQVPIGMDEFLVRCPSCEGHSFADVVIISKYFHVYFIPIFPFQKEANIVCKTCGLRRNNIPFERRLFSEFDNANKRFRHPWYTYSFVIFMLILILSALFA
jgi:zinc ribbon protein